MDFKIGDKVTRNSYNNDIIFIITDIIDNTCYLKGLNFRLCADSTISDLKKYTDEVKEDLEYLERIKADSIKEDCPVHRTLELLSGKWRTHIIYELCKHPTMRFGELKKAYPHITNTMLTNTLRDLESLGIIHREQFNEIPPHVEYSLTEKGKALLPVFFEISKWGEENL